MVFEAVLEERHVGRAAQRLNLTPSAVSHGLGRLRGLLNDPLFLRTPKGVVATARAIELGAPVADVLRRARQVIATAQPFDPSTSARWFTIGAPDGVSAVFLPQLSRTAWRCTWHWHRHPALLPRAGEPSPDKAWHNVFGELDDRVTDIAVVPSDHLPARFHAALLYEGLRCRRPGRASVR